MNAMKPLGLLEHTYSSGDDGCDSSSLHDDSEDGGDNDDDDATIANMKTMPIKSISLWTKFLC